MRALGIQPLSVPYLTIDEHTPLIFDHDYTHYRKFHNFTKYGKVFLPTDSNRLKKFTKDNNPNCLTIKGPDTEMKDHKEGFSRYYHHNNGITAPCSGRSD